MPDKNTAQYVAEKLRAEALHERQRSGLGDGYGPEGLPGGGFAVTMEDRSVLVVMPGWFLVTSDHAPAARQLGEALRAIGFVPEPCPACAAADRAAETARTDAWQTARAKAAALLDTEDMTTAEVVAAGLELASAFRDLNKPGTAVPA